MTGADDLATLRELNRNYIRAAAEPKKDYEAVDVNIRILGDVALIYSGFHDRRPDGTLGKGRYTDIYARRGGRWLCVSANVSRG